MAAGRAGAKEMSTVVALVAVLSEPCGVCTSKEEQREPTKAFLYKWCFCFMLKWLYQELAAAARYDVRLNLALGTIEALELEHRSWTSSRNLRTTASSPAPITTADGSAGLLGGGEGWEPWWEFLLSCCKSHQQHLVPGSIDSICQTEIIPRTPPPLISPLLTHTHERRCQHCCHPVLCKETKRQFPPMSRNEKRDALTYSIITY